MGQTARANGNLSLASRRWAILRRIQENGYADVQELSQLVGVSKVSIRRDLAYLEQMGVLERVHGGAHAVTRVGQTLPFEARLLNNVATKRAIGQAASALIQAGDIVFLDAGTTVLEITRSISPALLSSGGLTVITRSLAIASLLRGQRNVRLIVLGGLYVPDFDNFVGPQVESALQNLHADILFIGIDGVTAARGLTTDNVLEASLYPSMIRCADRVVVVTDSSKIGVEQLQAILALDEVDTFVTDTGAPGDFTRLLQERGIESVLVPPP